MRETDIDPDSLDRGAKCNQCGETTYAGTEACPDCGSEDMNTEWNSLLSNYDLHDVGEAYFVGRMHQIGLQTEQWGIDKRHHDGGIIFDNKMDIRLWEPLTSRETPAKWPSDVEGKPYDSFDYQTYRETCIDGDPELGWAAIDAGIDVTQIDRERDVSTDEWELRGVVDVKTKSSEDWMGKFNLRHLTHYAEHAKFYAERGVPTFLYFTMVDVDTETVGDENLLLPIPYDWEWERLESHYDPESDVDLTYGQLKDTARTCDMVERTFRAPDGNLVVDTNDDYHNNFDYFVSEVL